MIGRAFVSSTAILFSVLGTCCFAAEPNETFAEATILQPGVLTTGMQSFDDGGLGVTYPDTTLGLFSDTSFSELIDSNDDFLLLGNGFGSALGGEDPLAVPADGSVPLAVSGWDDSDFDGLNDEDLMPHSQSGDVQLILLIWDDQTSFNTIDDRVESFTLQPGEVFEFPFQDASWAGNFFTAIVDNTIQGGNDVDFWRFTGMPPGALYTAEVSSETEDQDTYMGLFDSSNGLLLVENDDADPFTLLSAISDVVPASGDVVLSVTSFDDFEFIGAHDGFGSYTLTISYDGDTDSDNDVDGDDLLNMLLGFGTAAGATRADGDSDRDGDVDRDDVAIWQVNAGVGVGPLLAAGQATAIPEPSSALLAFLMLSAGFAWRYQLKSAG